MKKSKIVGLVLISSALASCHKEEPLKNKQNVYMRSDTTAAYSKAHYQSGTHNGVAPLLWWYAFRPYGSFNSNGGYSHAGYYSNGISENSNLGRNTSKSSFGSNAPSSSSSSSRGGFGRSSFHVSS
jgi:hypothetical protein